MLAVQASSPLISGFTLSPELSGEEIIELANRITNVYPGSRIALLVEGNVEAMVTADNLLDIIPTELREDHRLFGLLDATDRTFPIHIDSTGRSHIFNASELCLLDHLPELAASGVNMILIDARYRGSEYARGMVTLYREALGEDDWIWGRSGAADVPGRLKPRIREMARGGITAGHYDKGCIKV